MIYPFPRSNRPGTPLLHLFDEMLAPQLLPLGTETGVLSMDDFAGIWVPDAKLAITTPGSDSPIEGFTPAEAAEMTSIDILAIDLAGPGDLVACELALFAMHREQKFSVPRLALWVSPHGLAGLVPVQPRNAVDRLPPCFALTPTGVRFLADPFLDAAEWRDGIDRAVEAIGRIPAARPAKRTPLLRIVR